MPHVLTAVRSPPSVSFYAHCFLTRRRLSLALEQLQKPLSAPARELPRGQPSSWETAARLDKGVCVRVRRGDLTRSFSGVISSLFVLHVLLLQPIRNLAQVVVYEYSRNCCISEQGRELAQERSSDMSEASMTEVTEVIHCAWGKLPTVPFLRQSIVRP